MEFALLPAADCCRPRRTEKFFAQFWNLCTIGARNIWRLPYINISLLLLFFGGLVVPTSLCSPTCWLQKFCGCIPAFAYFGSFVAERCSTVMCRIRTTSTCRVEIDLQRLVSCANCGGFAIRHNVIPPISGGGRMRCDVIFK